MKTRIKTFNEIKITNRLVPKKQGDLGSQIFSTTSQNSDSEVLTKKSITINNSQSEKNIVQPSPYFIKNQGNLSSKSKPISGSMIMNEMKSFSNRQKQFLNFTSNEQIKTVPSEEDLTKYKGKWEKLKTDESSQIQTPKLESMKKLSELEEVVEKLERKKMSERNKIFQQQNTIKELGLILNKKQKEFQQSQVREIQSKNDLKKLEQLNTKLILENSQIKLKNSLLEKQLRELRSQTEENKIKVIQFQNILKIKEEQFATEVEKLKEENKLNYQEHEEKIKKQIQEKERVKSQLEGNKEIVKFLQKEIQENDEILQKIKEEFFTVFEQMLIKTQNKVQEKIGEMEQKLRRISSSCSNVEGQIQSHKREIIFSIENFSAQKINKIEEIQIKNQQNEEKLSNEESQEEEEKVMSFEEVLELKNEEILEMAECIQAYKQLVTKLKQKLENQTQVENYYYEVLQIFNIDESGEAGHEKLMTIINQFTKKTQDLIQVLSELQQRVQLIEKEKQFLTQTLTNYESLLEKMELNKKQLRHKALQCAQFEKYVQNLQKLVAQLNEDILTKDSIILNLRIQEKEESIESASIVSEESFGSALIDLFQDNL